MKARRRHELQHNVLDAELARGVDFLRRRRTLIVWSLVLVAAGILAITYAVRSAQAKERSLQDTYDRLITSPAVTAQEFLDGMKSLAECTNKRLAAMATVQVGKYYSAQFLAAGGVWADPRERDLGDQAAAYFHRAIDQFSDHRQVVAEAHLGLGRLAESTGDFAAAAGEYKTVKGMADLVGTPAVTEATEALGRLDRIKAPVRMASTSSAPAAPRK